MMHDFNGCFTALITPMDRDRDVDWGGLKRLVDFQQSEGITGLLFCGTTGASPTLSWEEHRSVIETGISEYKGHGLCIAGTGSNCTEEAMNGTEHAVRHGADAILLVDPYYNGPSSLEMRKEYYQPIAQAFPRTGFIPYIIPGRTGTQLMPEDVAQLSKLGNVNAVKEATGNLDNMKKTRRLCGDGFQIVSGDDDLTFAVMTDPGIRACGVISVASNVAPRYVTEMVTRLYKGDIDRASELRTALQPLFELVTVKTTERTPYGEYAVKARNPLAYHTLMNILGMPSGELRQPLGKMTRQGLDVVLSNARQVHERNPEILEPVERFFKADLEERLYKSDWSKLAYKAWE